MLERSPGGLFGVARLSGRLAMKIAEVSRLYDISADTLRYYERVGLITGVARDASGIRS